MRRLKSNCRKSARRTSLVGPIAKIALAAAFVTTTVGCFVPIYSARPERRVQQLLYTSEDLRTLVEEWERFWHLDQPSHMTPIRTHGGIM